MSGRKRNCYWGEMGEKGKISDIEVENPINKTKRKFRLPALKEAKNPGL